MLKLMRSHASSWLIKMVLWLVVFAFVGTIFYSWGVGRNAARSDEVARVFDEKISYKEYSNSLDNLYNYYRNAFKGRNVEDLIPRSQIKKVALDNIIRRKLLLNEAREMGIEVTDQEVIDNIRSLPTLQNEGRFDNDYYLNFLKYNRLTAKDFENNQRIDLILTKTERLVKDSVTVSEPELREAYKWKHQQIKFDYFVVKTDFFKGKENLTDQKISEFYIKEKEKFRKPAQVNIEYLFAEPVSFESEAKVDTRDIEDYYKENGHEFMEEETARASHILIKRSHVKSKKDGKGEDSKEKLEENLSSKEKAENLLAELKKGANFEEMAKKISEDKASAVKGGDVGEFTRGKMLKEFEEAAFSLKVGELSEVVETFFGYHIIKLTEKKEARVKPLSSVEDEIKKNIVEKRSKKLAKRSLLQILKSKDSMAEFNNINNSSIKSGTTGFFSAKEDKIPLIGVSPEVKIQAFSLNKNEISRLVKTDKGFYLLKLLDKKESYIPELPEVKDEVAKFLSQLERDKLTLAETNRLNAELGKGNSMAALAEQAGIELSHSDFIEKSEANAGSGLNKAILDRAFQLKEKESAVVPVDGEYFLVYLTERSAFNEGKYSADKKDFQKSYLDARRAKVLTAWMENLRKKADVTINEQIL